MNELLNDIDFLEKFLEKYLERKSNSLRGKVKIIDINKKEVILEVDDQEITIKIDANN